MLQTLWTTLTISPGGQKHKQKMPTAFVHFSHQTLLLQTACFMDSFFWVQINETQLYCKQNEKCTSDLFYIAFYYFEITFFC